MITQVDEALRAQVRAALQGTDVEVVLDAPTKDWAARRNAPTVDVYLYDLREDLRRRSLGLLEPRDADGKVTHRIPPPRQFKLSYLVTAWTQRPEDEHRLLDAVLQHLVRFDALPGFAVPALALSMGQSTSMLVGLPPPEDRSFADVWTALGGELKPSIDVVVTVPADLDTDRVVAPPVTEPMELVTDGATPGWVPTAGSEVRRRHRAPVPTTAALARGAAAPAGATDPAAEIGSTARPAAGSPPDEAPSTRTTTTARRSAPRRKAP
ncbi:DUF4255 domain-containing protein [Miniimonas sp. S16]|uniref:DUF4255 domain-containing protein n=1 Tax=Miniimonas sp. S16 TaxID=2171623 RepID=UPI000D5269DC|nr:DUF4255 domain-containing protein [Miniimonas sp. S16]